MFIPMEVIAGWRHLESYLQNKEALNMYVRVVRRISNGSRESMAPSGIDSIESKT